MAESPSGESTGVEAEHGPPVTKKSKRQCHFDPKWSKELKGISRSSKGKNTTFIHVNIIQILIIEILIHMILSQWKKRYDLSLIFTTLEL